MTSQPVVCAEEKRRGACEKARRGTPLWPCLFARDGGCPVYLCNVEAKGAGLVVVLKRHNGNQGRHGGQRAGGERGNAKGMQVDGAPQQLGEEDA